MATVTQVSEKEYRLDRSDSMVNVNGGKVRVSAMTPFIPDVVVIPMAHTEPFPFVAEVWSPPTGDYDVRTKINSYRERGDAEVRANIDRIDREIVRLLGECGGFVDEATRFKPTPARYERAGAVRGDREGAATIPFSNGILLHSWWKTNIRSTGRHPCRSKSR